MKFVFTCGGTAGHINPALAVAGRLKELMPESEFLFIGAEDKMEMNLVPREGYDIRGIRITNISRAHNLEAVRHNLETIKNVALSVHSAKKILKEFKPDAVIGTGGYVCYPVLTAAHELHIPTAVHESNAVPGLTTRMLADRVDRIMVGFEDSRKHYNHPERVSVTGTPVRGEFSKYTKDSAKCALGLPADKPLVVSVWGSLGAAHMNDAISDMIPLMGDAPDFQLIHSAGSMYYSRVSEKLSVTAPDCASMGIDVREYIYNMPCVMAAADVIMCRAGASTLAELTYMGKPAVIVPSPNVTNNHQEKNARVLENAGAAIVLLEGEFDAHSLLHEVCELLANRDRLAAMEKAMLSLGVRDAADRICAIILELINK